MNRVSLSIAFIGILVAMPTIANAECIQTGTITSVEVTGGISCETHWTGLTNIYYTECEESSFGTISYRTGSLSRTVFYGDASREIVLMASSLLSSQERVEVWSDIGSCPPSGNAYDSVGTITQLRAQ